ncbi:MAG: asparagine synthase (glutamine-hydrolyzing) [Armatimonadetes bacterium]|nr:asparagine synthase (glutamine-hydrolyzing) [Armatimonadota bacterium]
MCGIFGVINLGKEGAPDSVAAVTKGIKLQSHRGPDGYGVESGERVVLGHTRLSIIDLESGQQPMWNSGRTGLITYNGEVYNFPEIKVQLEKRGHVFKTRSDTEVVLNAFIEWGPDCLRHFRGMFAFAAVDVRGQKALIARDRLGKKPLFYVVKDGSLFFSSELEPLYQTVGPFRMDLRALDDYLSWQYIPAPGTIYQEVRSLPPAHLLHIDLQTGAIEEKCYWKLSFGEDRSLSIDEWERHLDEMVREAVRLRLVSDVPFGAFLSGGIDSSLVVGYMAEILEQPVKTFSIGFKEADFSELRYAEEVARLNRTDHNTEIVEADSLKLLPLLVRHYGQPFADSSAIPTYHVSRMSRKHVKMVLSGDGGDENFAGYNSYEYVIRAMTGNRSDPPSSFQRKLLRLGRYYLGKFASWLTFRDAVEEAYSIHCGTAYHFSPEARRKLFKGRYRSAVRAYSRSRRSLMDVKDQPLVSRLQNLDLMAYLPFDILTKVDIASMANSLEVRVPLLDHVLVEKAAKMPAELKFREERVNGTVGYDRKHILKRLARKRYPPEVIDRPKMGFGVPLGAWFAGKLNEEVKRRLLDSEYLATFFDRAEIAGILARHNGNYDNSARIWNLLFLEEWMRSHSDAVRN